MTLTFPRVGHMNSENKPTTKIQKRKPQHFIASSMRAYRTTKTTCAQIVRGVLKQCNGQKPTNGTTTKRHRARGTPLPSQIVTSGARRYAMGKRSKNGAAKRATRTISTMPSNAPTKAWVHDRVGQHPTIEHITEKPNTHNPLTPSAICGATPRANQRRNVFGMLLALKSTGSQHE